MTNKRGQVGALSGNVIGLGIAAIVLVLLLVIAQNMRDMDIVTKVNSGSAVNESLTTVNQAGDALDADTNPACVATIVRVINGSTGIEVPSTNYTTVGCIVYQVGGGYNNNTPWNVTYSFTYADQAYVAGNKSIVGLATFADFWVIIVLAIVAAVVIGIIFGVFSRKAR